MNPARSVATLVQVFLGPFVVLLLVLNSQIVMAGAQSGSPTTDPSKPSASDMTLELMTPPEDVDFGPYLASVF